MFSDFMEQLARGERPEEQVLARKLAAALTKKLGVLQIAYLSQSSDPKINPPARQLLAAAAFLGDREKIQLALDILRTELAQRHGDLKTDAVGQAIAAAMEETARLLSAFPEELALWQQVVAALEKAERGKSDVE